MAREAMLIAIYSGLIIGELYHTQHRFRVMGARLLAVKTQLRQLPQLFIIYSNNLKTLDSDFVFFTRVNFLSLTIGLAIPHSRKVYSCKKYFVITQCLQVV